jgi:hypothetical protein
MNQIQGHSHCLMNPFTRPSTIALGWLTLASLPVSAAEPAPAATSTKAAKSVPKEIGRTPRDQISY